MDIAITYMYPPYFVPNTHILTSLPRQCENRLDQNYVLLIVSCVQPFPHIQEEIWIWW